MTCVLEAIMIYIGLFFLPECISFHSVALVAMVVYFFAAVAYSCRNPVYFNKCWFRYFFLEGCLLIFEHLASAWWVQRESWGPLGILLARIGAQLHTILAAVALLVYLCLRRFVSKTAP